MAELHEYFKLKEGGNFNDTMKKYYQETSDDMPTHSKNRLYTLFECINAPDINVSSDDWGSNSLGEASMKITKDGIFIGSINFHFGNKYKLEKIKNSEALEILEKSKNERELKVKKLTEEISNIEKAKKEIQIGVMRGLEINSELATKSSGTTTNQFKEIRKNIKKGFGL